MGSVGVDGALAPHAHQQFDPAVRRESAGRVGHVGQGNCRDVGADELTELDSVRRKQICPGARGNCQRRAGHVDDAANRMPVGEVNEFAHHVRCDARRQRAADGQPALTVLLIGAAEHGCQDAEQLVQIGAGQRRARAVDLHRLAVREQEGGVDPGLAANGDGNMLQPLSGEQIAEVLAGLPTLGEDRDRAESCRVEGP